MEYYCDTVKHWRTVLHGEMALITAGWDPDAAEPFTDSRYDESPEIRVVDAAPIHPRRVTHSVLVTNDLEGLVAFYQTVGGLEEVGRSEGLVYLRASLSDYPYHLAICGHANGSGDGYHHVSFELESVDAVDGAEKRLVDQGVAPEMSIDNDLKRSFYLRDPDGLLSEYYARRSSTVADVSGADPKARAFLV
jgi:catechol 2,3-dioxygenase